MHPVHVFLVVMMLGGLLAAWYAQRARYGPGNFGALVALSVLASAIVAWIVVAVLGIEAPGSDRSDRRPDGLRVEATHLLGDDMDPVNG
jgi:hypothetical protein